MKIIDGYNVAVKVREDGPERFLLIVETSCSDGDRQMQQRSVPHQGGYISIGEAARMAGYVLKGIDRVDSNGRPNLNVV